MSTRGSVREHTGISMGIGALLVTFLVVLPVLIVVGVYSFVTVYAIVKTFGDAPKHASATTVLIGVVALTTVFVTLLAGGIALVGRALDPKKRE